MDDGQSIPVTVLDVSGNKVTQVKTIKSDGYSGVQIGFGVKKKSRTSKSLAGHFAKAGVEALSFLKEFRIADNLSDSDFPKLGQEIPLSVFNEGQLLDITGITQGKGFQGAIKRHGFSSQRTTHGNSVSHRAPGSIGMCQDPGRVFKGKRMAGHMGSDKVTTQNLTLVRIDEKRELLLVKGSVPGSKGREVFVKPAVRVTLKKSI
jgi:large subunit ribosomal protein L3